jgi:SpoIID/LytB domain protein
VTRTSLRLLTALAALALLAPATAVHANGDGYPVRDSVASVGDPSHEVRFEGAGWGHGVGMSQYGAYARARAGQSRGQILRAYFTGTDLETRSTTNRIDVGLRQGVSPSGSTHVDVRPADGSVTWRVSDQDGSTTTLTQGRGERWFVCANASSTRVQDAPCGTSSSAREDIDSFGARDVIFDIQHNGTVIHTSDAGGEFRWGTHRIIRTGDGLTTIQRVPDVETYLKGIAEVPDSWGNSGGAAALQAQAIAARGYALTNDRRGHPCFCDILNSTTDQVYHGWHKERQAPNWVAAVERTQTSGGSRGEVLTHNGSIIPAFYSSSNGGRSENVSEVWGSNQSSFPYLRSVDDSFSVDGVNPYRSWTATASNRAVARALDSRLRSVEQLSIEGRTAGGTPKAIAYRGRDADGNEVAGTLSNSNGVGAGVTLRSRLSSGVDVVRADGSAGVNALPSSQIRRISFDRPNPFDDIAGSVHEHAIIWTHQARVAQGYDDGTFRPGNGVTRGQMASFIYRTFDIPASDGDNFRDVDPRATHGDAINALADAGIAQGFDDGNYRPGASVTRAQMASFLARAIGLRAVAPDGSFRDVSDGPHAGNIHAIAEEGITRGCDSDRYCPNDTVRRGQMASFLYRTVEGG